MWQGLTLPQRLLARGQTGPANIGQASIYASLHIILPSLRSAIPGFQMPANTDNLSPALGGDRFDFNATAIAVPEPAGLPIRLMLSIALIAKRGVAPL